MNFSLFLILLELIYFDKFIKFEKFSSTDTIYKKDY